MKTKHKSGFSLIEIMVATLVLAVLALGGAQALYHTGAVIQNQEQKRMAVDQAMERLELVKRINYVALQPSGFNAPIYFVDDGDDQLGGGELVGSETMEIAGKRFAMLTRIERFNAVLSGSEVATEFLQIGVSVIYDNAGQQVKLDTIIVPGS